MLRVQLQSKTTSVETAGHAGTLQSKLLDTENIDMFRHPSYYKKLKEFGKRGDRGKPTAASPDTDQAISDSTATAKDSVRPGPGPKRQASSNKLKEPQATSDKHQAPITKAQA